MDRRAWATYTLRVDPDVATLLRDLTRAFYRVHAETFAVSRQAPWPGWFDVPTPVRETASVDSVLDVGCGNGRYLAFLRSHGFTGAYTGLDSSGSLLRLAETRSADRADGDVEFVEIDVLDACALDSANLPKASLVVAWGVLHHVPGFDARVRFLQRLTRYVAPGGSLCVSLWQFRDHPRFASREIEPSSVGIAPSDLEPGDALLDWQSDRDHPRYCHHFSDDEIARIAKNLEGGRTELKHTSGADRYNAYLVWTPTA